MADQRRIRNLIPGGAWYLSSCLVSFLIGGLSGFATVDFFPEGSDGPVFVGVAVGGRVLAGLAEHASDHAQVSGGD
jgi:hypothetical protein